MKFTLALTINKNRQSVWKAFDDPKNMKRWMPTLESFESQSGTTGQIGAVSKLTFREDGRSLTLLETITRRDEPNEFAGTYIANGVVNILDNKFVEMNPHQTQWTMDAEYKFTGFMGLVAPLMRKAIVKRTRLDMERFKSMVEAI